MYLQAGWTAHLPSGGGLCTAAPETSYRLQCDSPTVVPPLRDVLEMIEGVKGGPG